MNEPLTRQEREELITRKIESGLYRSRDDVIDTALRLLEERDRYIIELREKVQLSIDQIERGEYVEYTDETLHELFEEIEAEGLRELEARRKSAE